MSLSAAGESPATQPLEGGSRRYLYAIVAGNHPEPIGLTGMEQAPVYGISDGVLTALVSDLTTAGRLRPERRNLAAHQGVLKQLTTGGVAQLPIAFGMVAETVEGVRSMLASHREALVTHLQRVAGKVEMGLRVNLVAPSIFEYFVAVHAPLREERDRLLANAREAGHDEKIALGRLFDRLLQSDRERHQDLVTAILAPFCAEIRAQKCREEREVLKFACLVEQERLRDFERAILEAARQFDDNFSFDYNGPWAPHNFVDLDLKSGSD